MSKTTTDDDAQEVATKATGIANATMTNTNTEETVVPETIAAEGEAANSPATVEEEAPKQAEKSLLAITSASNKKLCGVCNDKESKYKCSRCFLPYCSIACSTIHKATHPAEEPKPTNKPEAVPEPINPNARAGTVAGAANSAAIAAAKGPFAVLDDSKELQELFKKYPRLRKILDKINKATLPPLNNNQQNNGGNRKQQMWNTDRGLEKGVKALNELRNTGDKDGKAVREFSKLILRVLSEDNGISARELVEREVMRENQQIIEQMLNTEL